MPVNADIKELLAAGAHFGHKTSRWHPKMAPYIHSKREGAHIINLEKTVEALDVALPELTKLAAKGKKILFVGTKKQLKDTVKEAAESVEKRYNKLEVQRFQEEIDLLNERYGGIKEMAEQPVAVIVTDMIQDKNAVKEANTLNIPVFAICDTNTDPSEVAFPIPANDDAIKSVKLILDYFAAAIKEGKAKVAK